MADNTGIYTAASVSALGSIAHGFADTSSFKSQLNSILNAKIANMRLTTTNYELEQQFMSQQIEDINEVLGDKLSERSLQAIKNEAILKAAAAETGTSGGTTAIAVMEAKMAEQFDRGNIIADIKNQQKQIMRQMDVSTQRLKSDLAGLSSGIPTVGKNSLVAGLAGGLGAFSNILGMMSDSQKSSLFK